MHTPCVIRVTHRRVLRRRRGDAESLEHPGGGTVFTTGCVDWPFGLDGGEEQVEQVTRNVLDRLGG